MSRDAQEVLKLVDVLGNPRHIAATAEIEYRRLKFAVRHPLLTFGVLPLLLLPVLILTVFGASILILEQVVPQSIQEQYASSPRIPVLVPYVMSAAIIVTAILITAAFIGLANRCSLRRFWPLVTAIVVGIFCLTVSGMGREKAPDHMGQILIAIGSPFHVQHPMLNALQFVAPIAMAGVLLRNRRNAPTDRADMSQRLAA